MAGPSGLLRRSKLFGRDGSLWTFVFGFLLGLGLTLGLFWLSPRAASGEMTPEIQGNQSPNLPSSIADRPKFFPRPFNPLGASSTAGLGLVDTQSLANKRQELFLKLRVIKASLQNVKAGDPLMLQIEQKIKTIGLMEEALISSLKTFDRALVSNGKNRTELADFSDEHQQALIDQFQSLVITLKGNISSQKKVQAKLTKDKETEENAAKETAKNESKAPANIAGIVENVMKDIKEEADSLETKMKHDTFKAGANSSISTIETVVKIDEDKEKSAMKGSNNETKASPVMDKHVTYLIDSDDNEYTLTKASDITLHYEDIRLLNEILLLLLCCFVGNYVMHMLYLPSFFGSILAGVVLGSSGHIKSVIQVDTIARGFGIVFIMFCLGLEFSFPKIRRVWAVSITSSVGIFVVTVLATLATGAYLGANPCESIMVGSCLSLSSTLVCLGMLKEKEAESGYGRPMIGILIVQDILLGFILALMPTLASPKLSEAPFAILRIVTLLPLFVFISFLLERRGVRYILRTLEHKNHETFLAVSLGYCILVMKIALWMDLSTELACFIAGVMIASEESHAKTTISAIESLRSVFSSLFFASIGLFIYPSFLMNRWFILLILTLITVIFKSVAGILVMRFSGLWWNRSIKIGVGLAQVSEFCFILSSRAKNGNIIQRETYYALLGVTVLSMLLSPLLWYTITWFYPAEDATSPDYSPMTSSSSPVLPTSRTHPPDTDKIN